jgi:PAS domain S-box-containing protein/excisionase family DNA binding protein
MAALADATRSRDNLELSNMPATPQETAAAAFRYAPIAMIVVSVDEPDAGRVIAVNQAACALMGYPEDELVGMHRDAFVPPAEVAGEAEWQELRAGARRAYRLQRRVMVAGGRVIDVEVDAVLVESPRCAIVYVRDVESRAQAEPTVTLGEAAHLLGVSTSTLRRWADSGRLETVRTSGGHRRFARSALRALGDATPGLRTVPAPTQPIVPLARALGSRLGELLDATVRALYTGPPQGWFASPVARRSAEVWAAELENAARSGDYASVQGPTLRLLSLAERAGATPLERELFIERFGEAAIRALDPADLSDTDVPETRRLFAHLRPVALSA